MSHFAKVIDGIVETVHVVEQDYIDSGKLGDPNNWIQTSYNTRGGVHYAPNSNEPDGGIALRKNFASIGDTYDQTRDAFIAPQPYPSWTLNKDTCLWSPPTPYPEDGKKYRWDEDTTSWVEIAE
tara:strand:- start:179 stop:550 length:372 start_codon:yes stop_codon:yes gene_type:complete